MDFGAVVVLPRLVLAEGEHARQRGEADLGDLLAQEEPRRHLHRRLDAGGDHEAIGAGNALGIEQGMDHQRGGVAARPFNPELDEAGEFLAGGGGGVDGEAARREAVVLPLADGAEVARALEHQDLVLVGRPVDREMDAKAVEADIAQLVHLEPVLAEVEQGRVERQRPLARGLDQVHLHRLARPPAPAGRASARTAASRPAKSPCRGGSGCRGTGRSRAPGSPWACAPSAACRAARTAPGLSWRRPRSRRRTPGRYPASRAGPAGSGGGKKGKRPDACPVRLTGKGNAKSPAGRTVGL